jgi:alpha,alpha-trehalase
MERLLRIASPLGLYAEEFDADGERHLGNFPQAFSHLALIEAAGRIILAERLRRGRLIRLGPCSQPIAC